MEEKSYCLICKNESLPKGALICPVCQSAQTVFEVRKHKYPNIFKFAKVLATAIFIPAVLWFISTKYADRQQNLLEREKKIAEISSITPHLRNSRFNLYSTCLNMEKSKCVDKISKNINLFNASVSNVLEKTSIHKPDLVPSVLVLSTLNVESEVSNIWNRYFVCLEEGFNEVHCNSVRKKYPLMQLEVADFIIDYIECDLQLEISKLKKMEYSSYCNKTVSYRKNVAKQLPREIMKKYDGSRLPKELYGIKDKIIQEYILPGSGLTVTINGEPKKY